MQTLTPQQARERLLDGRPVPDEIRVSGRLDLTDSSLERLPAGLHCYDLIAAGLPLVEIPEDLAVDNRLVLDGCRRLAGLPEGLRAGALSLRDCDALESLPEGLDVAFLDLTNCRRLRSWPRTGQLRGGYLRLRNCAGLSGLPHWLTTVAQLDISGCPQIDTLPATLKVTGWIDVGGSGLSSLPPTLPDVSLRWRGVRIDERIAFHPETLSAHDALKHRNTEVRRVMIERMGYLRFMHEARAQVLDADTDAGGARQLLKIDLPEDEPIVGLFCRCPSTAREYFLRVPPTIQTCRAGAAWMAGFDDPALYQPVLET